MSDRFALALSASVVLLASGLAVAADEPVLNDGELVFPEGADIPRGLTNIEREYLRNHPLSTERATTPPPTGPVRCPAEYEPMQGIILAWENYSSIQTNMVRQITTVGNAQVYIMCDTASESSSVISTLTAAGGIDMSKVQTYVVTTDTVWIRDYGPRYIYEGGCRAVVDHVYNRPRPADDAQPSFWANVKHLPYYGIPLTHGGGNYHLDALNHSFCTRLVVNENPTLTEQQIHDHWFNYQAVDTHFFNPFPVSIDSTQHLDMWMEVIDDHKVMISDWPSNPGSAQDVICDGAATYMASQGYTVFRLPAFSVGGVHYTYCNVVMCNNVVLVPTFTNGTVSPSNATALATWASALPTKTIVGINCESMISAAGAMHCIAMHVPVNLNGANPTAYLRTQRSGGVLQPATNQDIRWITDDDVQVVNVDIQLSTDGGATWPTTIAAATADDGLFTWTVPDVYSTNAKIRVVARDNLGNLGSDESPIPFTINGTVPACPGDADGDHMVGLTDVAAVINSWGQTVPPGPAAVDLDGSGDIGLGDMAVVIQQWGTNCP